MPIRSITTRARWTHGSVPWFRRKPQAVFDDLRAHGKYGPDDTIVQVNHPRDAIQGYFNAYGMTGDALSGEAPRDFPGKAGTFARTGRAFGKRARSRSTSTRSRSSPQALRSAPHLPRPRT